MCAFREHSAIWLQLTFGQILESDEAGLPPFFQNTCLYSNTSPPAADPRSAVQMAAPLTWTAMSRRQHQSSCYTDQLLLTRTTKPCLLKWTTTTVGRNYSPPLKCVLFERGLGLGY